MLVYQGYDTVISEDGDSLFHRNVGNQLPGYVTPKTKALFEEYSFLGFEAVKCRSS
jgi:hypothetical protein